MSTYSFTTIEDFRVLSQKEQKTLSAEDKKSYSEALEQFTEAWRAEYPNGYSVTLRVKGISMVPNQGQHAVTLESSDPLVKNISPNGVFRMPVPVADVLARNAGFASFSHMGILTTSVTNKGEMTINVILCVKGEKWEGRSGSGTYKSTFLNVDSFEYLPSPQVAARMGKATEKAAQKGYEDLLSYSADETNATSTDPATEEKPEDVEV